MITLYDSGTVTANGVATATLSQPAVPGKFTLKLDLVNLAAGDYASVLISAKALAGGALRALWGSPIYAGAQTYDLVIMPEIPNDLTESTALQFDLSYSTGGSRSIPWALMKDDALVPTTAGRTLDVTATGAAGVDWANVEGQSTAVNLSATNIDTDQVVASVTGAVGSVTGNVGGNVAGSVGSVTGNVGGNVVGSVGSVTADVGITQAGADKVFGASGAAMAELAQAKPSATPSPRAAIMLLYMALRNLVSVNKTTAAKAITNDAGTVIAKKALTDDGTTYTEAEMESGP